MKIALTEKATEDRSLFLAAMRDVTPLLQEHNEISFKRERTRGSAKKLSFEETIKETVFFPLSDPISQTILGTQKLLYPKEGLPSQMRNKLQKGLYPIDQTLDLHGETIESARLQFCKILDTCHMEYMRCLLIIHGMGTPRTPPPLKNHIEHWLKQIAFVRAFASACPRHGGTGSLYVLLKKHA